MVRLARTFTRTFASDYPDAPGHAHPDAPPGHEGGEPPLKGGLPRMSGASGGRTFTTRKETP